MSVRPIVYLDITDISQFIYELENRNIREVRKSEWRKVDEINEWRKVRFTAYDPEKAVILRFDVKYYADFYVPRNSVMAEKYTKKIKEAYEKIVKPVEEKIGKVAKISNGEYNLGKPRW